MDFYSLVDAIYSVVDSLIPLLIGVAMVVFFWGLVVFIAKAGSEDARQEGKQKMVWGVVAIFVMVAIWGIIGFIDATLGLHTDTAPPIPQIDEDIE